MIEFADVGKESLPKCISLSRDISKFENSSTRKKPTLSFIGQNGEKCYFSFPKQKQVGLFIGDLTALQDLGLYTWSGMPDKNLHKSDSQETVSQLSRAFLFFLSVLG